MFVIFFSLLLLLRRAAVASPYGDRGEVRNASAAATTDDYNHNDDDSSGGGGDGGAEASVRPVAAPYPYRQYHCGRLIVNRSGRRYRRSATETRSVIRG